MDEDESKEVMGWVIEHFKAAQYENYIERDGKPRYLAVKRERKNGFTIEQLISVRTFAELLLKEIPDFRKRPLTEVVATIKKLSKERAYNLEPLLEQAS